MDGPTEEVRDPARWEDLGQVRHGIEAPPVDQLVDERVSDDLGLGSQRGELRRGEGSPDDLTLSAVLFPVTHEGRSTATLVDELVETHAETRTERVRIVEDGTHVVVAGHGVDVVRGEPDHRTCVTQCSVVLVGFAQCLIAEEVCSIRG